MTVINSGIYRPDLIWKTTINFWTLNFTLFKHLLHSRHYRRMKTTFAPHSMFSCYPWSDHNSILVTMFSQARASGPWPLHPAFSILIPLIKYRVPMSFSQCYFTVMLNWLIQITKLVKVLLIIFYPLWSVHRSLWSKCGQGQENSFPWEYRQVTKNKTKQKNNLS